MELDFSKLDKLPYRGFETAEAREAKDALIEQGFRVVEDVENPFTTPTEAPKAPLSPSAGAAPRRPLKPLTGLDPRRNYRAMYRAVCDFHERHNPPTLEGDYWSETADDMTETANRFDNDPFLTGLLLAVFEELEREYKSLTE